jgi:hypothetical protein
MLFTYFNAIRYDREVKEGVEPAGQPYAEVEVTGFDNRAYKMEVYQWEKVGEAEPDLFEAIMIFNDRPGYLAINYYYLDLIMRGMDSYR